MFFNGKDSGRITGQISAVALLLLSFWVLCYRLDSLPMFLWDESRQANNALEMLNSGNLWYTTYDGKPDFWNTKPHLLVLLQWGCMKLLGPGLLALRLPSAIAGCIVLWVGFVHLNKRFGFEPAAAWVAVMIGCGGFNTYHIVRTGDYDALLTLFVFLASLSWLKYLENTHEIKFLKYMAIWFTAAILTKGVAAAMWLPCWIAMGYGIKPRADLKGKRVAMYAIIPLLCVFIYYGFHEWHTPGYLHAVLDNEFSGRYLKPNEGHASPWYYYIEVLWSSYFAGFLLLMPVAGFFIKRSEIRIIHYRLLIGIVLFLIIISLSATRIYWYLAPVIPLMALVVVLPLCINIHAGFKLAVKLLIAAITVYGYFENYHHNNVATGVSSAKVLLEAEKNGKLPFQAVWHAGHYHPVEKYYAAILAAKGIDLKYSSVYDYKSGDTLIVSSMDHLDTLNRRLYMRQQLYPTDELPVWVMVVDSAKRH